MAILDLQSLEVTTSEPDLGWNNPSTLSVANCGASTISDLLCL